MKWDVASHTLGPSTEDLRHRFVSGRDSACTRKPSHGGLVRCARRTLQLASGIKKERTAS